MRRHWLLALGLLLGLAAGALVYQSMQLAPVVYGGTAGGAR